MINVLYKSFASVGGDHLLWKLSSDRLRILCYHGVCDDRLAAEKWLPSYFVTRSAFELQLQYLRRWASVLPLSEAVRRLRTGTLPANAVSLTFEDGYANNVHVAVPLLEKYGLTATVFLATSYVETGQWYPFLILKLLRLKGHGLLLPDYKSTPVDRVLEAAARHWPDVEAELSADQRETLRPMTVAEVRAVNPEVIEFGSHSHTHAIARNEDADRRRNEVSISVRRVLEWTGRRVETFSYPNGQAGEFGEPEKAALRAEGIQAAVTGIAGANRWPCDLLELKRYPMTLHHDESRFRAELAGLRTMLLSVAGSRRSA